MGKRIPITCEGFEGSAVKLGCLREFQEDIKDLTKENFKKLRQSILEQGIFMPIVVWIDPQDELHPYIIDGHQRFRVLRELEKEGYDILVPVVRVQAKSMEEAKRKVLYAMSVYGTTNTDKLYEFLVHHQVSADDFKTSFHPPDIDIPYFLSSFFGEGGSSPSSQIKDMPNPTHGIVKQLILYYPYEEFAELIDQADKILAERGVQDYSALFKLLVEDAQC